MHKTTQTKLLPQEKIGDDLPCLLWQRKRIIQNCRYQDDIKEEWVQAATGDDKRTSLKSITQKQARWIIMAQEGNLPLTPEGGAKEIEDKGVGTGDDTLWSAFDSQNGQHRHILSLCRQAQWTTAHPRHVEVADLVRLDQFLKSKRCPVNKPLKNMTTEELVKVGHALSQIIKHIFK